MCDDDRASASSDSALALGGTVLMTRREFLYHIWAASMALFVAEAGGAILWFAIPRFRAGEFGGIFEIDVT